MIVRRNGFDEEVLGFKFIEGWPNSPLKDRGGE